MTEDGRVLLNSDAPTFGSDKGYMSQTLSKFKLGVLSSKQWIGDQVVLDTKRSRLFTVVAQTHMKVLEIDVKDFFLRIPKDYIKQLQWLNMQKVDFISDRMFDIALT